MLRLAFPCTKTLAFEIKGLASWVRSPSTLCNASSARSSASPLHMVRIGAQLFCVTGVPKAVWGDERLKPQTRMKDSSCCLCLQCMGRTSQRGGSLSTPQFHQGQIVSLFPVCYFLILIAFKNVSTSSIFSITTSVICHCFSRDKYLLWKDASDWLVSKAMAFSFPSFLIVSLLFLAAESQEDVTQRVFTV